MRSQIRATQRFRLNNNSAVTYELAPRPLVEPGDGIAAGLSLAVVKQLLHRAPVLTQWRVERRLPEGMFVRTNNMFTAGAQADKKQTFRPALFLLFLLLGSIGVSPTHAGKKSAPPSDQLSPKLSLASTPSFGFAPVTVQLVATLKGIDQKDTNYCHASITWVRVEPGPSPEKETRITESPRCVHGNHETSVTTTFSKSFELDYPGSYLYRVSVAGKDGKEVRSNYVSVKVLRVP
jgi:hypothetical protein